MAERVRREGAALGKVEEGNPICDCGLPAPLKCCVTGANVGRRFFCCGWCDVSNRF